jgi:hypothetical protein
MTAVAGAQDKPAGAPVSSQELAAGKSAEWDALAGALETKLARMLPCDARVRTTIEEVGRASEARLNAITEALKSAVAQSKSDADGARSALTEQEMNAHEMDAERAESQQEQAAVEAQLSDLRESVKHREVLAGAQARLEAIAATIRKRVAATTQQSQLQSALTASLRDLVTTYDARQKSAEEDLAAAVRESARWSEYYAARLARAQTECTLTTQAPRPQQKKRQ